MNNLIISIREPKSSPRSTQTDPHPVEVTSSVEEDGVLPQTLAALNIHEAAIIGAMGALNTVPCFGQCTLTIERDGEVKLEGEFFTYMGSLKPQLERAFAAVVAHATLLHQALQGVSSGRAVFTASLAEDEFLCM